MALHTAATEGVMHHAVVACCLGTPGQTKVSGDRQRETTHEACCLAAEFSKSVTGQELIFAVSYSKLALINCLFATIVPQTTTSYSYVGPDPLGKSFLWPLIISLEGILLFLTFP